MIFHSSTNGIRIINTDDSDIEMVYHHFFKHSTHFSILEFIFFNECCQAESICKEFYISSSSLYRIISQINKVIKKQFQFEISLTPVQIIGNERDICYFFAQYFSEKYYFLEWPFENFSSEPLSQLLELVYKETSFPMNLSTHRMLKLLLVMSNFDQYYAKSVAETFSYYCSNNFELEVWTELELSKESIEESPYDIIISNFIIPPIENKRLIYSNNINTISLISLLNDMMFIRLDE